MRNRKIKIETYELGRKNRKGICESCGASGFVEDEWEDQALCKTCGDISLLGYRQALLRGVFVFEEG